MSYIPCSRFPVVRILFSAKPFNSLLKVRNCLSGFLAVQALKKEILSVVIGNIQICL